MRRAYVFGHAFFAPRKAWQSGGRLMAGNLRGMFTEAGDVMMVTWREILFFLILFGANLIQAITGFAGTLLAMPPSMQLLGVDVRRLSTLSRGGHVCTTHIPVGRSQSAPHQPVGSATTQSTSTHQQERP